MLQYHIIFVCKYRNKLLMSKQRSDVEIVTTEVENWDSYDMVFIGYPIWWGIAAWPMNTFVENNGFTGKTMIPVRSG